MTVPANLTVAEMQSLPPAQKSAIRKWYDSVHSGSNALARAKMHAAAAGKSVRQGGEALLIGGMLGAMSVELPTGLDYKGMPMDAVLGISALLGGVAFADQEYGSDLTNIGAAALTVFAFRKTEGLLAERKRRQGKVPGYAANKTMTATGDFDFGAEPGEDPIVSIASRIGQGTG